MMTYRVKCRRDKENIDPKMFRIENNRLIRLIRQSKCSFVELKSQDL